MQKCSFSTAFNSGKEPVGFHRYLLKNVQRETQKISSSSCCSPGKKPRTLGANYSTVWTLTFRSLPLVLTCLELRATDSRGQLNEQLVSRVVTLNDCQALRETLQSCRAMPNLRANRANFTVTYFKVTTFVIS